MMLFGVDHKRAAARIAALLAVPRGLQVGVLGLGVAGRAMALYLTHRGAEVTGFDQHPDRVVAADELRRAGVQICKVDLAHAEGLQLLCIGPGVDPRQSFVQTLLAQSVPICGELELCGELPARVVSVTGTNGKSTTTALIGELERGLGRHTFVGANFGDPVVGWLDGGGRADVAVLELSSFQLETAYSFRTDVAVVLNVTPDHTDRYDSIEQYARVKRRVVECVATSGVAVLSADDPRVALMAGSCQGRVFWFSTARERLDAGADGATVVDERLVFHGALASIGTIDLRHPRLFGRHNRENAAAAFLAAVGLDGGAGGADARVTTKLVEAYRAFAGLPHRLQWVDDIDGVQYINDSKATNQAAAATAMLAMRRPVVLLCGGRDKGGGYGELLTACEGRLRAVIAFGEARENIATAFAAWAVAHEVVVELAPGLHQALLQARAAARAGDVVLLAPACSSFDEFENYGDRGRRFAAWVAALRGTSSVAVDAPAGTGAGG